MRLCVFIGDMYRDFALSVLKQLDSYAPRKGYHIDVFGTCSVPTTNPLHVIGFRSILSLPDIDSYDGILVCYDTLVHEGMARDLIKDITQNKNAPPLVCIRSGIPGVHCVLPDNRKLMHDIAAHVISKCHSADIGFVTGNLEMPDSYELSTSIGTCEKTEWSLLMDSLNKADRAMYLEKRSKRKNR